MKKIARWKCCHGNNFCQNLQKTTEKLCWTFMKVLWKYKKFMLSFKEQTDRYALKLKNKNGCHDNNFGHFFMKLQIKYFIGINMLYKFGNDRWKLVAVRGLSFQTDTVSISPLQRCWLDKNIWFLLATISGAWPRQFVAVPCLPVGPFIWQFIRSWTSFKP